MNIQHKQSSFLTLQLPVHNIVAMYVDIVYVLYLLHCFCTHFLLQILSVGMMMLNAGSYTHNTVTSTMMLTYTIWLQAKLAAKHEQ